MSEFLGLDPILRLNSKLGIQSSYEDIHPALSIVGIFNKKGPLMEFMTPMSVTFQRPLVLLVGCGGTGSHLLPNILQYLVSKNELNNLLSPEVVLIDGDVV